MHILVISKRCRFVFALIADISCQQFSRTQRNTCVNKSKKHCGYSFTIIISKWERIENPQIPWRVQCVIPNGGMCSRWTLHYTWLIRLRLRLCLYYAPIISNNVTYRMAPRDLMMASPWCSPVPSRNHRLYLECSHRMCRVFQSCSHLQNTRRHEAISDATVIIKNNNKSTHNTTIKVAHTSYVYALSEAKLLFAFFRTATWLTTDNPPG